MATRNGNVLIMSGVEDIDERLVIGSIQADTTGVLYQVADGSTSVFWTPNAAGDVISFDGGLMVQGLATTGVGDGFQVFLR